MARPALVEATHTGVFICFTKGCRLRVPHQVEHPYNSDWPLPARQHRCKGCRKNLTLYSVKRIMTDEARKKLAALNERRRKEREES